MTGYPSGSSSSAALATRGRCCDLLRSSKRRSRGRIASRRSGNTAPVTISPELAKLAAAHGVAIEYKDQLQRNVHVPGDSVVAVLRALGVDATSPAAVSAALDDVAQRPATPPVVVMRQSQTRALRPDGSVGLFLESGEEMPLRTVDGRVTLSRLPTGWHTLRTS